jgi:hypothetical protein
VVNVNLQFFMFFLKVCSRKLWLIMQTKFVEKYLYNLSVAKLSMQKVIKTLFSNHNSAKKSTTYNSGLQKLREICKIGEFLSQENLS